MSSQITLDRHAAKYLVDVALSACSDDYITPIICGAHIQIEDDRIRVTVTDRYRVHTALVDVLETHDPFDFICPRDVLLWLRKNIAFFGRENINQQQVIFEPVPHRDESNFPGELRVTVKADPTPDAESVSLKSNHFKGNYPAALKLVEDARSGDPDPTPRRLNLALLGKMSALSRGVLPLGDVKFLGSEPRKKRVYVAFKNGNDIYAEALLQGNLDD